MKQPASRPSTVRTETYVETRLEARKETRVEVREAAPDRSASPPPRDEGPAAIPTNRITFMDIHLATVAVFANGRQQIQVDLEVWAVDELGFETHLTDEEKKSIRLIDYRYPDQIVPDSSQVPPSDYRGWASQTFSLGYAPFPGPAPEADRDRHRDGLPREIKDFETRYLTSNGRSMESLVVAFSVLGQDGVTYRSNGTKLVDGHEYNLTGCDAKDRIVSPQAPEHFASDRFVLTGLAEGESNWFDRKLKLWIGDYAGPSLGIRSAECRPGGILLWDDFSDSHAQFTGYAGPASSALQWHPSIAYPEDLRLPELVTEPGDERICVIELCGRDNFYPKPVLPGGEPLPSEMTVHMIDIYGTDQSCRLRLVKRKWGFLEIY